MTLYPGRIIFMPFARRPHSALFSCSDTASVCLCCLFSFFIAAQFAPAWNMRPSPGVVFPLVQVPSWKRFNVEWQDWSATFILLLILLTTSCWRELVFQPWKPAVTLSRQCLPFDFFMVVVYLSICWWACHIGWQPNHQPLYHFGMLVISASLGLVKTFSKLLLFTCPFLCGTIYLLTLSLASLPRDSDLFFLVLPSSHTHTHTLSLCP